MVGSMYENREDMVIANEVPRMIPFGASMLLQPYRQVNLRVPHARTPA